MNIPIRPPRPGFNTLRDSINRLHFRPTAETEPLANAFRSLQSRTLTRQIVCNDPVEALALALLLFEAIITYSDLESAVIAAPSAYNYRGQCVIDWVRADGRLDRRYLGAVTVSCLRQVVGQAIDQGKARNAIHKISHAAFPLNRDPVAETFRAASAWGYQFLDGVLIGHVTGQAPFTALPRSALVREVTGKALALDVSQADLATIANDVVGSALEIYFHPETATSGTWAVAKIEEACSWNRSLLRSDAKKQMLRNCQRLSFEIRNADPISALILGWSADLVESGTNRKIDLHPGTVDKYVHSIATALHSALQGEDILRWSPGKFDVLYKTIIGAATPGNQGTVASALKSWHAFLVEWLDIPVLANNLHEGIAELLPAANTIWPHEVSRIADWLDFTLGDRRLLGQLRVAIELLGDNRLRASELLRSRLNNFQFYLDQVPKRITVDVAPLPTDGTLKSESARRTMTYENPEAIEVILEWHRDRIREGALANEYMFGDPHDTKRVYRLGAMYSTLNSLTKAATGDYGCSVHTWGHASISRRVEQSLLVPGEVDIDELDVIATIVGQFSSSTTIRYYSHCYERVLRQRMDNYLRTIDLSSIKAAFWCGVSPTTLRQRAHAKSAPLQEVLWDAIISRSMDTSLMSVESNFSTGEPRSPLASVMSNPTDIEVILAALSDISDGELSSVITLRARRDLTWLRRLVSCIEAALAKVINHSPREFITVEEHLVELAKDLGSDALGADFTRIQHSKWESLRRWLSRISLADRVTLIRGWEHCHAGKYLSLADANAARDLLESLAKVPIGSQYLALSISAPSDGDNARMLLDEAVLQTIFNSAFGRSALVEYKKPRRGRRPRHYLIWSSLPIQEGKDSGVASLSLGGFNSLMLALSTLSQYEKDAT
jgi:integrase